MWVFADVYLRFPRGCVTVPQSGGGPGWVPVPFVVLPPSFRGGWFHNNEKHNHKTPPKLTQSSDTIHTGTKEFTLQKVQERNPAHHRSEGPYHNLKKIVNTHQQKAT